MLEDTLAITLGLEGTLLFKTALYKLFEHGYIAKKRKYDEHEKYRLFKRSFYKILKSLDKR